MPCRLSGDSGWTPVAWPFFRPFNVPILIPTTRNQLEDEWTPFFGAKKNLIGRCELFSFLRVGIHLYRSPSTHPPGMSKLGSMVGKWDSSWLMKRTYWDYNLLTGQPTFLFWHASTYSLRVLCLFCLITKKADICDRIGHLHKHQACCYINVSVPDMSRELLSQALKSHLLLVISGSWESMPPLRQQTRP